MKIINDMSRFLKLFAVLFPLVCACEKLPDVWITVSETGLEAPYDGGNVSLSLQSFVDWKAEIKYLSGGEGWISLPVSSGGKGQYEFVVRVAGNPERTREAKIYITPSDPAQIKYFVISQVGTLDRDMSGEFGWTVVAAFDTNSGPMTYENVMNRKSLIFNSITPDADFRGLDLFKNLTGITVRNTSLQSLAFKGVPQVKSLYFEKCELGGLDISGMQGLESLRFKETTIPFLDTSGNPNLKTVDFDHSETPSGLQRIILGARVEGFGISNTKSLEEIDCSQAVSLSILSFNNCSVRRLDISKTRIEYLDIMSNPIDELLLPPRIQSISLNMCTGSISSLTAGARTRRISVSGTPIKELDVTGATSLEYVYCSNNLLEKLDLSKAVLPSYLNFVGNPGVGGVFELIVTPGDYEEALERYERLTWDMGDYVPIVTKVVAKD